MIICGAVRDLVSIVQFKKRKKHQWRSTKSNTPPWVFFTFLKLYKWYQIAQNISFSINAKFSEQLIFLTP